MCADNQNAEGVSAFKKQSCIGTIGHHAAFTLPIGATHNLEIESRTHRKEEA